MSIKHVLKKWLFLLCHNKGKQMCVLGSFMMGLGFGFWHTIGSFGLILYYKSWE